MSELKPCPFCDCRLVERGVHPTFRQHPRNGCLLDDCTYYDENEFAAWNRRAEPGWQPISSAPRDGTWAEPSAAWRAQPGKRQGDPAGFVRLVQENPGFWLRDFALKYLTLTIDTRDPTAFWLADRDGKPIDPQRVLDAIAPTPAHAELSPGNSSDLRGEEG